MVSIHSALPCALLNVYTEYPDADGTGSASVILHTLAHSRYVSYWLAMIGHDRHQQRCRGRPLHAARK